MSKTFVSIIMWSSNRFWGILCAVMMLVLSGIPLSAAEKQKSKRLEDGSLYRYPLLDGLIVGVDLFSTGRFTVRAAVCQLSGVSRSEFP